MMMINHQAFICGFVYTAALSHPDMLTFSFLPLSMDSKTCDYIFFDNTLQQTFLILYIFLYYPAIIL